MPTIQNFHKSQTSPVQFTIFLWSTRHQLFSFQAIDIVGKFTQSFVWTIPIVEKHQTPITQAIPNVVNSLENQVSEQVQFIVSTTKKTQQYLNA